MAARIPIVAGDFNGVVADVQHAGALVELGRTAAAQAVLDAAYAGALSADHRDDGKAMLVACRADLDVRLGNHDEALRRLLPWLRHPGLLPSIRIGLLRSHVGYLLAAARFDEVGEQITAARRGLPLSPAEADLFDLYRLTAAAASDGLGDDVASALDEELAVLCERTTQPYLRRLAAVMRAQLAFRRGSDDAADRIAAARAELADDADAASRQMLETTAAALLLRAHERESVDPARLRHQLGVLESVWRQLSSERSEAPPRPSGVAFLHYAFRRDLVAQRFGLSLAIDDSERGRETAVDMLLQGREGTASLAGIRSRALAGDAHGVLVYLPGGDASYVVAIDRTRITWNRLAGTQALHARMRAMADRLEEALALAEAAPGTDLDARCRTCLQRLDAAATALATALLPPDIGKAMGSWRRLSLVGSEMLPLVPFECLPYDQETLGQRFAMDRWPGITFSVDRAEADGRAGDLKLAFFGKVARGAEDPEIRPAHVDPWLTGYQGPSRHCGDGCTLAALRAAVAADVLVVLAHGERRVDRVRPHVLRFADGDLGCEEVDELTGAPWFVLLAACNAALGPNRFGASTRADLAGAFLARGAHCVAASPFALRLEPTRTLLATALPALADGAAPAEAMRRARVAVARSSATLQGRIDAWTTAPLAVFGYGQRPLR